MSAALSIEHSSGVAIEREGTAAFVLSLRARGISDLNVLRAMEKVPRDFFAPRRFSDLARSDVALPIACGQTMTAPGVVAGMLATLDVRTGHRVLEIGTGSGYVAALLARMGASVHSIERQPMLAESACDRLAALGVGDAVLLKDGDGLQGGSSDARFDRILLNGAVSSIGPMLTSKLVGGGRLVGATPVEGRPRLLVLDRDAQGQLRQYIGSPLRISALQEPAKH